MPGILASRAMAVLLTLLAASCTESGAATRLLLQSQLPEGAPQTRIAQQFAREAAQRSAGRLEIVVVASPPGAGWPRNIMPLLDERKADLVVTYFSSGGFREAPIGMLPGLVNSREQSIRFPRTPLAQTLTSRLEAGTRARNLVWLWEKSVIASKGPPVRFPEDARGIPLVRAVGAYVDLFREVGTAAAALPLREVWTTMDRGLVGAAVVPVWLIADGLEASRAADSIVVPESDFGFYSLMSIAISRLSFDGLPPDLQRVLLVSAAEAQRAAPAFLAQQDKLAVESFASRGKSVIAISSQEFSAWIKLARDSVWTPLFTRMELDENLTNALRAFQ